MKPLQEDEKEETASRIMGAEVGTGQIKAGRRESPPHFRLSLSCWLQVVWEGLHPRAGPKCWCFLPICIY